MVFKRSLRWLIAGFLGLFLIIFLFIPNLFLREIDSCNTIDTLQASAKIMNDPGRIGFALDKEILTFGSISSDQIAKRAIRVQYSKDAFVKIKVNGSLSPLISSIEPNNFLLKEKEIQGVTFTLEVPQNTKEGNYSGTISICYQEK